MESEKTPVSDAHPGEALYLTKGMTTFNMKVNPGLVAVVGRRSGLLSVFHPESKLVLEAAYDSLRRIEGKEELEARRILKRHQRSIEALIENALEKTRAAEEEEQKIEEASADFRPGLYVIARGKDKKAARGGKAAYLSGARVGFVAPDGGVHRSHILNIRLIEEPPPFWKAEAEKATREIYEELIREQKVLEELAAHLAGSPGKALVEIVADNKQGIPKGEVCELKKVAYGSATVIHNGRNRILAPTSVKPK